MSLMRLTVPSALDLVDAVHVALLRERFRQRLQCCGLGFRVEGLRFTVHGFGLGPFWINLRACSNSRTSLKIILEHGGV